MKLVGAFLVLPIAFFGWMYWSTKRIENELRPIPSAVAGHPIQVDCQGYLASLVDVQFREGEVHFDANGKPDPKIFLTRPTCKRLDAFAHARHHSELDCLANIDWTQPDPLPPYGACAQRASPAVYALLILTRATTPPV